MPVATQPQDLTSSDPRVGNMELLGTTVLHSCTLHSCTLHSCTLQSCAAQLCTATSWLEYETDLEIWHI